MRRRRRWPPPTPSGSERPKRIFSPKNASFERRGKEGEGRRKCSGERGGSQATIDRTAITALELCPWQPTNHCFINCSVAEGGPKVSVYYVVLCKFILWCFFFGGGGGGDQLKTQDGGWMAEGSPRIHCVLFCVRLLFVFKGGWEGEGDQLKNTRGWIKALSLEANKSLLHKLFGGGGGC